MRLLEGKLKVQLQEKGKEASMEGAFTFNLGHLPDATYAAAVSWQVTAQAQRMLHRMLRGWPDKEAPSEEEMVRERDSNMERYYCLLRDLDLLHGVDTSLRLLLRYLAPDFPSVVSHFRQLGVLPEGEDVPSVLNLPEGEEPAAPDGGKQDEEEPVLPDGRIPEADERGG